MVNNTQHTDGVIGVILSTSGAIVSNLDTVEVGVRILAGLVAIVAGLASATYYVKKIKNIK